MKIKIGVFFGGMSVEHEVSIISAIQAINKIDQEKYDKLQKQEKVLDLIIQELTIFPKQLLNFSESIEELEGYIIDLIRTIKLISTFYYNEKKIWCRSVVTFYNLAKELALAMPALKTIYYTLVTEVKFNTFFNFGIAISNNL